MKAIIRTCSINDTLIKDLSEHVIKIESVLTVLPIVIVEVESVEKLEGIHYIEKVEQDELFYTQNVIHFPNLRINKLKANNYLGTGSMVGVIDSGINQGEVEVARNEVFSSSKTVNDSLPYNIRHGTYVARIIKDIAPWSILHNLKVSPDDNKIKKSSIIKALNYAYENGIKIINMSLAKPSECKSDCIVCNMVNQMVDEGFAIITVIGNFGRDGDGITGCPGNAEKAFTVGAVNAYRQLADFSSTAKEGINKPNVLAPGYFTIDQVDIQGTSFAAPYVTGIVSALSGKFRNEFIFDAIQRSAVSIGLPPHKQGHGLVNIEKLLGVINDEKTANQG